MRSLPLPDWMAGLDGQRGVWELTIPGTHDSGARRGGLRPVTQTMDILGQLEAGIRFFDVRLRDDAGVFRLYHGGVDQQTELASGVLHPMLAFLARHPGEALIMSVKQEDSADEATFARDFAELATHHPASMYVAPDFPRLAEGRGKIVVFRRFAGAAIGIPAAPDQWQDNATFQIATPGGTLRIEDGWDFKVWQLEDKWSAVASNLDAATASSPAGWYITYTSGIADLAWPRAIAGGLPFVAGINQRLLDYLASHTGPRRLGTIVMDFPELPDRRLIQGLVDSNG